MHRRLTDKVLVAVIVVTGAVMLLAQDRPPGPEPRSNSIRLSTPTRIAPTGTLEERLQTVDAVMRLRIDSAGVGSAIDMKQQVHEKNHPGVTFPQTVIPVTEYQTQVVEIVKGDAYSVIRAPLRIAIMGGSTSWQGREVSMDTQRPTLTLGATYLVFLKYSTDFGVMMFEPEDIYRVDGPVAGGNPLATTTEYGKRIVGQPSEDVLLNIRSMVTRTP